MDYTWSQFVAFSRSVSAEKKRHNEELFGLMFIAVRGSEDSVKAMLKSLEN
ncbi:MAG: hypothetical protein Q7T62_18040 [Undibacterium sp.]|nr:hypothetical protein [Undibacterium sp.]